MKKIIMILAMLFIAFTAFQTNKVSAQTFPKIIWEDILYSCPAKDAYGPWHGKFTKTITLSDSCKITIIFCFRNPAMPEFYIAAMKFGAGCDNAKIRFRENYSNFINEVNALLFKYIIDPKGLIKDHPNDPGLANLVNSIYIPPCDGGYSSSYFKYYSAGCMTELALFDRLDFNGDDPFETDGSYEESGNISYFTIACDSHINCKTMYRVCVEYKDGERQIHIIDVSSIQIDTQCKNNIITTSRGFELNCHSTCDK